MEARVAFASDRKTLASRLGLAFGIAITRASALVRTQAIVYDTLTTVVKKRRQSEQRGASPVALSATAATKALRSHNRSGAPARRQPHHHRARKPEKPPNIHSRSH